jgi:hypothetical protein
MDRLRELCLNAKCCICRRLNERGVTVFRFARKSGVPLTPLIDIVRGKVTTLHDLQELCSRLLLATLDDEPVWDPLTRRTILAVVLYVPNHNEDSRV